MRIWDSIVGKLLVLLAGKRPVAINLRLGGDALISVPHGQTGLVCVNCRFDGAQTALLFCGPSKGRFASDFEESDAL